MATLFQIMVASQTATAIDTPLSKMNKTNYGFQLESNVTNGTTPNEIAYRNPQYGIFMSLDFMRHCKIFLIQSQLDLLSL